MGSANLFSQLDLGKRSLTAQQSGMNVAGHNIANVNNDNFSRQRVDLDPQHPRKSRFGSGVDAVGVERMTDHFLTKKLVGEQSKAGSLEMREDVLRRLEDLFNDSEGLGLRNGLNDFWDSWGQLANQPEAKPYRQQVLDASKNLASRFHGVARDLRNIREEVNGRIVHTVERINQLSSQLARQNALVQQVERGGGQANDVRDEREGTLRELSKLVKLDWAEDEDHLINVNIDSGWPLVLGRRGNQLEASFDHDEPGMYAVKGLDPKGISRNLTGNLRGGELDELLHLRDATVVGVINKVDQLASELAFKVNRLHATGTGINSSTGRVRSSFALKADALVQPIPFLKDGIFRIHMVDDDNTFLETYEIGIDAGKDTLKEVVDRINSTVGNLNLFEATLNSDGSVTLDSKSPHNFILGEDETDFAAVMGFNSFFENLKGAEDFRLNEKMVEDPNRISTGKSLLPGDNSVALSINEIQFTPSMEGNSVTFDEFYNAMVAEIGLKLNRSTTDKQGQKIVLDQFKKLRDEVSSVNMDEEVADMVQYQRGFDAAAKFLTTVDEMTRTVISM